MAPRWPSPDAPRSEVQSFIDSASYADDLLSWTWEQFAEPNWAGNVGAWKAIGATGIDYGIAHNPSEERPWQLIYSSGPGNVTISGRGTELAMYKGMAEEAERKDRAQRAALERKPTEARRAGRHVAPQVVRCRSRRLTVTR